MFTILFIALIILIGLIILKVNAFLAFLIAAVSAGLLADMSAVEITAAIQAGLGNTLGFLTVILGFGAVIGRLMAVSGAAKQIADSLVKLVGKKYLNWAMAAAGFIIGIPLFFSVAFVIVVPLMFSVAKRSGASVIALGIPLAVSLSTAHGLLPPHPAPAALSGLFGAGIGDTIFWGMVIAIPTIIIAGPFFAQTIKKITAEPLKIFTAESDDSIELPSLGVSIFCAFLPITLLMSETVFGGFTAQSVWISSVVSFFSQPLIAMLISLIVISYLLQLKQGKTMQDIMKVTEEALSGIAMILLIIGGSGALNQVLKEIGVPDALVEALNGTDISPVFLCWGIAALIRIAVGSATVAAMTTAGILAPVFASNPTNPVLLVLAVGSGSLIFSHVNDGGFWLFKEYFNLTVKQTLLTWSVAETIISVSGLVGCLILNLFI
jgi:Gnt-I system high-affinity gluconate transporter